MEGDFSLTSGEVIRIVVGQTGETQITQTLTCGGGSPNADLGGESGETKNHKTIIHSN